ncbi:MAG TPA: MBL fold metallo-hydrolase [Burkholderiaceae bacterium]|nr:MBL fold metallo-hydrolase [Burkholderiaceae bacterium]
MSGLAAAPAPLPDSMVFIERDWLSSNQVLFFDGDEATLIDSGYVKHAPMTLALLDAQLRRRPQARLTRLLNTHLHSDHCGANAAIARAHGCAIHVPAISLPAVTGWDREALTHAATAQRCERFRADHGIEPGDRFTMGGAQWVALAAPGHDPHSLIFHCAEHRLLIAADALWENGFGVIFPELEGRSGFAEQQAVLELIASLPVERVLPGHGPMFTDVGGALARAHARLRSVRENTQRYARNALKVMIKFRMLDDETMTMQALQEAAAGASVLRNSAALLGLPLAEAVERCTDELVAQQQLRRDGDRLFNL